MVPSRGLFHDCEIFANLRVAFVPSSNAQCTCTLLLTARHFIREVIAIFVLTIVHHVGAGGGRAWCRGADADRDQESGSQLRLHGEYFADD